MGSISINFAEVEGGFEVMPDGVYPVVIEKAEVRESKSSDHPYINYEMTISEGEYEGRKLWYISSFSPKAGFRMKDDFIALGVIEGDEELEVIWDEDVEITPSEGPLVIEPELTGLPANARVYIDTYKGKENNKVDSLMAPDGITEKPRTSSAKSTTSNGGAKSSGSGSKRRAMR